MKSLAIIALMFAQEPTPQVATPDYAEFSKMVQKLVVKQLPKEFEDTSGWTGFIADPGNLRLGALRTRYKMGDQIVLPNGLWRKYKVYLEDSNRDLDIQVKDFQKIDPTKYRVKVDTLANVKVEGQLQHWQKGLPLIGVTGMGDAVIEINLLIDVAASLNTKVFPPELKVDPQVAECKVQLRDFSLLRPRAGERSELGDNIKDFINQGLRTQEGTIKNLANKAIADSLKDGKGTLSAGEMLKLLTPSAN